MDQPTSQQGGGMGAPAPKSQTVQTGQLVDAKGLPTTAFAQVRASLVVTNTPDPTRTTLANRMGQREKMHNPQDLIALAQHVQTADSHTKAIASGKLDLISRQIKQLQEEARTVLENAKQDMDLAHAKCNFQRRPGATYHLYKKNVAGPGEDEQWEKFFSMLSPAEWSGHPPHGHLGSYRLEYDMSWTPLEKIPERDASRTFNPVLLGLTNGQVDSNDTQLRLTLI